MNDIQKTLAENWRAAGINSGDIILIHSNITRTIRNFRREKKKCDPVDILNSLIDAVGQDGTLLFPTFDISVQPVVHFDLALTKSKMGLLTELARQHPRFLRSRHPLLSFACYGRHAEEFARSDDFTGVGHRSIFARLHVEGGKIAILNLKENDSMSFYHHVEYMLNVDYRWTIEFDAEIKDGHKIHRQKHGYYARRRDEGVVTSVSLMGEKLWQDGLYRGMREMDGHGMRTILAHDVYRKTAEVILNGQSEKFLYSRKDLLNEI